MKKVSLRAENPDPDAYKTASAIVNQFANNDKKPPPFVQKNTSVATKRKFKGWFF
jgi:hypothetical protein